MNKETYYFLKSHNICVRCGKENAEYNHTMCLECKMKNRERSFKNYHNKIKNKEIYLAEKRRKKMERYYKLKAKGICTKCGKRNARKGKIHCFVCASKIAFKQREKYRLNVYATRNISNIRV